MELRINRVRINRSRPVLRLIYIRAKAEATLLPLGSKGMLLMLLKMLEKLKNFVSPEKWETCYTKF